MAKIFRAVTHASELLTGAGFRAKDGRRVLEEDIGEIKDGALVYSVRKIKGREIPHRIEWVGPTAKLPTKFRKLKTRNLKNQQAVIAGMVDCHTHLIFAGDRSEEFAMRCAGATYQEIAEKGGGIVASVQATRDASPKELEKLAIERVREMTSYGVRTIEIKSGYGLSLQSEIKILETAQKLKTRFPEFTFSTTFLGAHAFPKNISREDYLRDLIEKMLPEIARRKLADSCDIFIDQGYFTVSEASQVLTRALQLGFKIKVHADELGNTESVAFSAEMGALSADHLLKISTQGIEQLARSQTVAVLLPATAFYLKTDQAPARKLIDAGVRVALSTDFNPGTSMCLSLPAVLTIAALYLGMSRAELLAAVTFSGAKALGLEKRKGTLEKGMDADFAILPFPRFEEIYYRFAWSAR